MTADRDDSDPATRQVFGFVVLSRFLKPVEELEEHLEKHTLWIQRQYEAGRALLTGPQLPRVGSVMILAGENRDEIVELLAGEPFYTHGLVEYQIIQFRPGEFPRRSPEADAFLRRAVDSVGHASDARSTSVDR